MSEYFRILPHDLVAEQSVLGAVFISPETMTSLADELTPDDFYKPANKIVFKTMLSLLEKGEPIDATTMVSALTNQGDISNIGGMTYVVELVNSTPTSKNVEHYAKLVKEKAMLRKVIADLSESLSSASLLKLKSLCWISVIKMQGQDFVMWPISLIHICR